MFRRSQKGLIVKYENIEKAAERAAAAGVPRAAVGGRYYAID